MAVQRGGTATKGTTGPSTCCTKLTIRTSTNSTEAGTHRNQHRWHHVATSGCRVASQPLVSRQRSYNVEATSNEELLAPEVLAQGGGGGAWWHDRGRDAHAGAAAPMSAWCWRLVLQWSAAPAARARARTHTHTHTHTHTVYLLETVGPREAHDVSALSDICRSGGTDVGRGRGCRQMRVYKMRAKPVYQL